MELANASDSVWRGEGQGQAGNTSERLEEYIFHQTAVKVPLLLLYSVVFVFAFFGEYNTAFSNTFWLVHVYLFLLAFLVYFSIFVSMTGFLR
ncbi:hypothetical protein E2C01_051609 [Portunus trituberculatus]|uniref:Uncharacterized protein n=1 Tax=Portunus trituberculatus TaxID=210409 RepID=A0A5B7GM88_PORTR|nr:hypothetical protein [Portunus trituberculatus]